MIAYYKNANGVIPCNKWEPNGWMHVECPSESEKNKLVEEFNVPIAFLNDIEDIDERPRVELEDDWYLIIIRIPFRSNDPKLPFLTAPLGIVFKDDLFISICHVKQDMLNDFSNYSIRKNRPYSNFFDLVYRLILSSSVWYLKYLKHINIQIENAEAELEKSVKNKELQRLLEIEKCLVYFTTSIKGNDLLINRIKNLKLKKETVDEELIEDVEIELKQAQETTKIYSDILSGMMDAYASVISNNLNIVMKRLTSISIILMIPTLIASLYGMNVPNHLENNKFSFLFIVLATIFISLISVYVFRKKRWF
ncbi:MAG: Magnesium transport protein CorA [Bacteroidetes bacterium ADurb.Bin408]|nr:MAG: Magnesium transport protein CorA [Bacteroidetes bacterium ADurb.Bin408]